MDFLIFIVAMGTLIYGANFIILESERIALHFKIHEFVIGATLVALGTSLPEMAASIAASGMGKSEMAIANVIGSNIINITLILGLVFLLAKNINPHRDIFAKDSAWILFPVLVFILMIIDGIIDRFDGALFLMLMGGYLYFLIKESYFIDEEVSNDPGQEKFLWPKTIALLIIGFALVIGGANFAIKSAANLAQSFGVSEWIIGLFLVSFGTSLPELIVSITAAIKGKADMSIGNIIGSNAANFTIVLGSAALTKPLLINATDYLFDIVTVIVASVMLVFITANHLYNKSAGIALLIVMILFLAHGVKSAF